MTIEEFNKIIWRTDMKVRCSPMQMKFGIQEFCVASVNFDQALIGTSVTGEDVYFTWWRCENCELINE